MCEGVVHPMDSGIGGGFQAIVYNETCKDGRYYLNAREISPMHWNYSKSYRALENGWQQIGVPSMLKGYEALYRQTSCGFSPSLEWKNLFEPSLDLVRRGFEASKTFNVSRVKLESLGHETRLMVGLLETVIDDGPRSSMYEINGTLSKVVLYEAPGIVQRDLSSYVTKKMATFECKFQNLTVSLCPSLIVSLNCNYS